MTIRVALNHIMTYSYDRRVQLGPQIIRLRPAPHCRTPIQGYSLRVEPKDHFVNWQQDPHSNYLARFVFPEPAEQLRIEVDLIAEMTVINPFDFFVEQSAEKFPFEYDPWLHQELVPFRNAAPISGKWKKFLDSVDRTPRRTVNFLVDLNNRLQEEIEYVVRMEPGVQTPEETLQLSRGSCRDTSWLLVQTLRHLGFATRFVSGYLIQLAPDEKPLDGPVGPAQDFTDLHAWAEVYLPGAGWIGMDPTSGLLAGEGHLPLACTPEPPSAAPLSGSLMEACEDTFDFSMSVTRIHEDPRVTRPYTDAQWQAIDRLGKSVDEKLIANDVRLTMGGEPTFVSVDDMEGEEWNSAAVGPEKRRLSESLIKRLRETFAPGGLLHYGQGKWYPGESLPRWALSCYWRTDGEPLWQDVGLIADVDRDYGLGPDAAKRFCESLAELLQVKADWIRPAYEDVAHYLLKERRLPVNIDPRDPKLSDPEERARMTGVFERGLGEPVGFVMPLQCQQWQARGRRWQSGPWPFRSDSLFLLPGDSPIGLRLPLDSLPWQSGLDERLVSYRDPMASAPPLPTAPTAARWQQPAVHEPVEIRRSQPESNEATLNQDVVRTALCVEPRGGRLHIFMPPAEMAEDYVELIGAIEATAAKLQMPVVIEGYLPPTDDRIQGIKVTPDPGVIEVNVHPASSWADLSETTTKLYEQAKQNRLGTEKFDLDGTHTGTGGGNHIVMGSASAADSPFLRRPDVLKSFLGFWNNHPSLSYLFSSRFIGPTSQAPRVDEGRLDRLYELELAFSRVPSFDTSTPPWLVDRLFRDLLVDMTGNTHRAEFCIDKLYSPDSSTGRLGLLELRGFEMPPHARMSLAQQLLIRGLLAYFWERPYDRPLIRWGTRLHDRFLLPYFCWNDFCEVLDDLRGFGLPFEPEWYRPHFEFRFPQIGSIQCDELTVELRAAIEPWYVLGEEPGGGGTVRYVDSSVERLQVIVSGMEQERYAVVCSGRKIPLTATATAGQFVSSVRYRAWQPPHCLHPTIPVHTPLVFDILDTWTERSIGGCRYHVAHPAGRNYQTFPVNANEAEARRGARFEAFGHTPGPMSVPPSEGNPEFPLTLDLRRVVSPR